MRIETSDIRELPETKRIGHTCANLNGELFFIWGGSDENEASSANNRNNANQLWIYETLTGYWRRRECSGECPPNLSGSTSCLIGRRMFIFGGYSSPLDNWLNNLYYLDLDSFVWTDLSSAVESHPVGPIRCDKSTSWTYNSRLFAFGGYGWVQTEHLLELLDTQKDLQFSPDMRWPKIGWNNQLVEFNPSDNSWRWPSYSGQCPSARAAHSGTLMGNKYFLFGGRDCHERLNDLYALNMDTFEWTQVANFASCNSISPSSSHLQILTSGGPSGASSGLGVASAPSRNSDSHTTYQQHEQFHEPFEFNADSEMDYFDSDENTMESCSLIGDASDEDCDQLTAANVAQPTTNNHEEESEECGCSTSKAKIPGSRRRSSNSRHRLGQSDHYEHDDEDEMSNMTTTDDDEEYHANNTMQQQVAPLDNTIETNRTSRLQIHRNSSSHLEAPKPTGRSFASFTPISTKDIILFGGINSQDDILDDCWLFNTEHNKWTKLELRQHQPRLWHSGSRTKNNELVIIGGSSSNKVNEFCSDVLTISLEPKSLKQLALDSVARSIRMKLINRSPGLPQSLNKLIKLRKQAILLTMRRSN